VLGASGRRLVAWILFVSLVSAVAYASRFTAGRPDRNALYQWSTAIGELLVFAINLAVTLAIARGRPDLLALRRPRAWPRALLLCGLLLLVVYGVIAAIDPLLHGGREQGLTPTGWQPQHAAAYGVNFVVIAGVAPFTEELLFRGLGFSLLERFGRWPAILIVGISFGLYHGLVQALPELVIFGCALAWLRSKTRSVIPGILLHATFNSIALIAAVTV
jgi:membrane protease YdiL (CAAX protease family)